MGRLEIEIRTALQMSVRPVRVELRFTNSKKSGSEGPRKRADAASIAQRVRPTGIAKVTLVRSSLNSGSVPSKRIKMIRPLKERERMRRLIDAKKPTQRVERWNPGRANRKTRMESTMARARAFFWEKTPCQSPK